MIDARIKPWWKRGSGACPYGLGGMICTGETYKNTVKMTFAKGASLEDPSGEEKRLARSSDGVFRLFESVTDSLQIQTLAREAQNPCSLFDFPT